MNDCVAGATNRLTKQTTNSLPRPPPSLPLSSPASPRWPPCGAQGDCSTYSSSHTTGSRAGTWTPRHPHPRDPRDPRRRRRPARTVRFKKIYGHGGICDGNNMGMEDADEDEGWGVRWRWAWGMRMGMGMKMGMGWQSAAPHHFKWHHFLAREWGPGLRVFEERTPPRSRERRGPNGICFLSWREIRLVNVAV